MKINFKEIEETVVDNFNNGDGKFINRTFNDGLNKILIGKLKKNCSIGLHEHIVNSEIIYVISGEGKMIANNEEEILKAGDVHYCKMGSRHTFRNEKEEDLIFFAVIPNHKQ